MPPNPVVTEPNELSVGAGVGVEPNPVVGVEPKPDGVPNPVGGVLGTEAKLDDTLGVDGVVGAGETVVGLFAASNAFACKSLSPPANMIPDSVPVRNVAIGIIISKNFWSIGLIAFNG